MPRATGRYAFCKSPGRNRVTSTATSCGEHNASSHRVPTEYRLGERPVVAVIVMTAIPAEGFDASLRKRRTRCIGFVLTVKAHHQARRDFACLRQHR